jgi:predicted transcriptional regulator
MEWKTGIYGKQILSTNDIAKKLGLTPGAVSQRASRILAKVNEGRDVFKV